MTLRIGVDIGGTFTDGVSLDPVTSAVSIEKVLTTSDDLSRGFLEVFDSLVERAGVSPGDVHDVMHASTVATNALLEHKGARVGLLVTEGFRDLLEIGRQVRWELYNLFTDKPAALVPRARVHEIRERIDYRGEVVRPLVVDDVRKAVELLRDQAVDSVGVCFLHSYRNPAHEEEVASLVRRLFPEAMVSVSSEIAPEIKEYWRASTTCVNAYVGPVVRTYLNRVDASLGARGFTGRIGIMHSGGGIESARSIVERPFQMIESGPAAGLAGAAFFARRLGQPNGLSFDMGGTTAKAGLILEGTSRVLPEFEVGAQGGSGASVAKASGYPILGEVVDLVEVGAGGGSLAWIDGGGHLQVGPEGAGSDPGPACYGRGGVRPTITDANLALGRLHADYFLGGRMKLDVVASERAISEECARPLGLSLVEASLGILRIANSRMEGALRLVSIERGHDPREFCLVGFGGAGPLHAATVAGELGVPVVLIPPNPGVASAWGLLLSDVKHDVRVTTLLRLAEPQVENLRDAFAGLSDRLDVSLESEETDPHDFAVSHYVEARYEGQSSRLRVEWPRGLDAGPTVEAVAAGFHREHEREFGYHVPQEPIQILTAGITAVARRIDDQSLRVPVIRRQVAEPKGRRRVVFEGSVVDDVPVFDRARLPAGVVVPGPALIEEYDSTTLVPPGFDLEVADLGVLQLRRTR